jgi:hypothetical protein
MNLKPQVRAATTFLILVLLCSTASMAQKKPSPTQTDREKERRSFAENVAKAINAAEADYFKTHSVYANWDTLIGIGAFSENGTKWVSEDFPTVKHALYGRGPEIVPGWRLRLRLSNGDKAYDITLEDVNDPKCGYAVTTNEGGTIRQGKFIDCP